ncbi:Alpha/Beta hydrolase protein [Hypoxylon crocopeplum]|nr:Alpha/Beta hydrolase protein [Hypoxylon crocopeplum]
MAEGTVEFRVSGIPEPCRTWYKVVGDLNSPNSVPLVILHGMPGASHDYLLPLTDLAPEIPLVFYDQVGGGRSTHLPDKAGDESFWSVDLFVRELDNLLSNLDLSERNFDVYGHSWGGMLAATWASTSNLTKNLRRLVISGAPASMEGHQAALVELRSRLPEDVQAVLDPVEGSKDFASPEYQAALEIFNKRHMSLSRPWPPEEVQALFHWVEKDPTASLAIYGPSLFVVTGAIRDWNAIPSLHRIKVPLLLLDGAEDTASKAVQPFFEHIEKVKWITLDNAAHLSHVDQRKKYMRHLRTFLRA